MYYDGSNPDFMRPIRDANREEYFLVEFHRTLKNTNMALLRNMIMAGARDPDFLKIFPNLYYFARMTSNDDLYNATVMYNRPDELVRFLSKDRLSADLCLAYAKEYMEPLQLERLHNTRLEYVILQLLEKEFLRKVYIFADKFTIDMQGYLVRVFGSEALDSKRIVPIEGYFYDCITEIPEVTTAFISNFDDLEQALALSPGCINGKMIIISDGYDNLEPIESSTLADPNKKEDGEPPHKLQYKGLELFAKWNKEKRAEVGYAYPYCIETPNEGTP